MQYVSICIFLIWVFFLHLRLTITTAITYKSNSLQFYLCVSCKRRVMHMGRTSANGCKKSCNLLIGATQTHFIDRERSSRNKRRHLHRMGNSYLPPELCLLPSIWLDLIPTFFFFECICVGNTTQRRRRGIGMDAKRKSVMRMRDVEI